MRKKKKFKGSMFTDQGFGIVLMCIQQESGIKSTSRMAQTSISEAYLGHAINCLAKPIY